MARGKSKKKPARTPLLASRAYAASLGRGAVRTLAVTAGGVSRATAPARVAAARKLAPISESARNRLREIQALLLFAVSAFLLLACASAWSGSNLCGPTGEAVARWLLGAVGYAAYLLILCLLLWALALFTRRPADTLSMRASGLMLCLVSFAGLLGHFFGGAPGYFPAGGVVGDFINTQLMVNGGLGVAGTRIALVVLTLITFALAADVAYYTSLVSATGWLKQRRAAAVAAPPAPQTARVRERDSGRELEVDVDPAPLGNSGRRGAAPPQPAAPRPPRRGLLARLLRRAPKSGATAAAAGESGAALQPFELLDELPGASIPLDVEPVAEGTARRAAAARKPAAGTPPAAKPAPTRAGAVDDTAVAPPATRGTARSPRADAPVEETPPPTAGATRPPPARPEVKAGPKSAGDSAAAAAASSARTDDLSADERLAAAARSTPVVRRPAQDAPVQRQLVPEPPAAAGAAPIVPDRYVFPTEDLLDDQTAIDQGELDHLLAEKTEVLERTLASFRVEARVVEIQKGPVISMFEMELAPGIKVEKVRSLEDDLAIALRARTVRIVAPIPNKNTIGIEVPNPLRETVRMKPLLRCREFVEGRFALPILLGRDASGRPLIADLARMPHLLVAGATGSGKSVCLNTIIVSLLYTRTPEQVKLILIDPKMVELSQFANAPHLASPVVSDMKRAPGILEWAIAKMEERYRLLSQAGVRNIYSYNKLGEEGLRTAFGERIDDPEFPRFLPFVVIVIDELADLMLTSAKEVETSISRLAAKSRAVGIHMIVATQRPSTNVITGLIKANLPTRIAFMVSSKIDSRVILDENGAEQLLGEGDLLLMSAAQTGLLRGQGTYLSEEEVRRVMEVVRQAGSPAYEPDLVQRRGEAARDPESEDELYDAAVRFVFATERGSASLLQRKFAIGYTRASRLIDMMTEEGVLGEYKGSQAREITLTLPEWIALKPDVRGRDEES